MTELIIKNKNDILEGCKLLCAIELEEEIVETPWELTLTPYKPDRSLAQNALMWVWNTHISTQTGETIHEVHGRNKIDHLLPLYQMGNKKQREHAAFVREVLSQVDSDYYNQVRAADLMLRTSKSWVGVKMFTEYLELIEKDHASKDISLPHTEDYNLAMKGKTK